MNPMWSQPEQTRSPSVLVNTSWYQSWVQLTFINIQIQFHLMIFLTQDKLIFTKFKFTNAAKYINIPGVMLQAG